MMKRVIGRGEYVGRGEWEGKGDCGGIIMERGRDVMRIMAGNTVYFHEMILKDKCDA